MAPSLVEGRRMLIMRSLCRSSAGDSGRFSRRGAGFSSVFFHGFASFFNGLTFLLVFFLVLSSVSYGSRWHRQLAKYGDGELLQAACRVASLLDLQKKKGSRVVSSSRTLEPA